MKNRLSLLILLIVVTSLTGCSKNSELEFDKDQNGDISKNEYDKYLEKNTCELNIEDNDDFSSFKLFEDDLKDKEIFLTGEIHRLDNNNKIKLKMLKYFKKKTNFKYILEECSYLRAKEINQYLKTGKGEGFNSKTEESKFWAEVFKFNEMLANKDKLEVVGIDIASFDFSEIDYIIKKVGSKETNDEIKEDLEKLFIFGNEVNQIITKDAAKYSNEENQIMIEFKNKGKEFDEIAKGISDKKQLYKELLDKDEMFEFEYIIETIKQRFDSLKDYEKYMETLDFTYINRARDLKLYDNFTKLSENLPDGKFFGQFGNSHVFQRQSMNVNNLAAQMNDENSKYKDKILSVYYLYRENYNPFSYIDDYANWDFSLIKLNGENSPFKKEFKQDFIQPSSKITGKGITTDNGVTKGENVTTDYYQYLVILK